MTPTDPTPTPPSNVTVRPLRIGEEQRFLDLVSQWPFRDDRRGEEFFARPMEHDERFRISDVFGAFVALDLVACCQVFPRTMRIAGEQVPIAGVGTVFTRKDMRRKGLASRVITAALDQARRNGQELALLHAARLEWYESQGFARWGPARSELRLADEFDQPELLGPALAIEQFDRSMHLEQVANLAATYCADRHGTLVRDALGWDASLALAGNPVEEFVVVQDRELDQTIAYLRGCVMNGNWQILEWACAEGHERHLAELIATTARTVAQESIISPRLADLELERHLRERGIEEHTLSPDSPQWMFRCIGPAQLGSRFGIEGLEPDSKPAEANQVEANAVLNILMPPAAFHFWSADRF